MADVTLMDVTKITEPERTPIPCLAVTRGRKAAPMKSVLQGQSGCWCAVHTPSETEGCCLEGMRRVKKRKLNKTGIPAVMIQGIRLHCGIMQLILTLAGRP